jgi:hydrogenase/urease accessory protein HupE
VALNSVRLLGTFGNAQKMRTSTTFALVGVFGLCCLGGAWLLPAVRKAALFNAASVVVSPAFLVAATTLKSAWAGLLAGCLHTLTGPDHLAALAPLTVGPSRAQNALMGALWGCGHNTGQMLFGLVFVLLKDKLPFNMEIIGQWGQGIVGGTLVIIGIMGWWEARAMARGDNHSHSHSHSHGLPFGIGKDMFGDGHTHSHSHSHDEGDVTANLRFAHAHAESSDSEGSNAAADVSTVSIETEEQRRKNTDGSFLSWTYITGTIHGLQPDALLLLLPAFALPRLQAVAFLGTFFVGTVVAMGTYTACLGAGTSALQKHNPKAVSLVSGISSAVAVAIGVAFILSAVFGFEIF